MQATTIAANPAIVNLKKHLIQLSATTAGDALQKFVPVIFFSLEDSLAASQREACRILAASCNAGIGVVGAFEATPIATKISNAAIRTTHVTGMVTDIGIELGKLLYVNLDRSPEREPLVRANREKLRIQASLFALFFGGGVLGAVGFSRFGYVAVLPLAMLLFAIAIWPVAEDVIAVTKVNDRDRG